MHGKLGYVGVTIYNAAVPERHDGHLSGRTDRWSYLVSFLRQRGSTELELSVTSFS